MAAVTLVAVKPVLVIESRIGKASADLPAGKPVVIDSAAAVDARYDNSYKAAVAETTIHGIVIKPAKAGGPVEVLTRGEMDGYSGLTPGAPLSVTGGAVDSTAPGANLPIQLIALNAARIWVKL